MKKLLSLVTAFLLAAALTACSSNAALPNTQSDASSVQQAPQKTLAELKQEFTAMRDAVFAQYQKDFSKPLTDNAFGDLEELFSLYKNGEKEKSKKLLCARIEYTKLFYTNAPQYRNTEYTTDSKAYVVAAETLEATQEQLKKEFSAIYQTHEKELSADLEFCKPFLDGTKKGLQGETVVLHPKVAGEKEYQYELDQTRHFMFQNAKCRGYLDNTLSYYEAIPQISEPNEFGMEN